MALCPLPTNAKAHAVNKAALEIRDPLHGPIAVSPAELRVIDSPYFQRLRGIKQTGFAELAFPGSTHNRYCHSLGAFHLAGLAFDQIFKDFDWTSAEEARQARSILRMAALLHDAGHGPLSHAIEQAMPAKKDVIGFGEGQATHEDYTQAILLKSSMNQVLKEVFNERLPELVAALIRGENIDDKAFRFGKQNLSLFPILSSLISGELDVDRMDYMTRDSHYCGVSYGKYDQSWLLSNMMSRVENDEVFLALDSRAIYAIEDFLLARYHMYLTVYLHHKSVVFDEMLFQFLKTEADKTQLPSNIDEYLRVDDYWLGSRLREAAESNPWAKRIIDNRPFRMLLQIHSDQNGKAKAYADEMEAQLKAEGVAYFRSSSTGLLSKYSIIDKNAKTIPSFPIYVIYRDPRFRSAKNPQQNYELLSDATELFDRYRNKTIIDRIYADRPE